MDYSNLWEHSAKLLEETRAKALKIPLNNKKFVIFSDLHMGNGGSRDDFRNNGPWFYEILSQYYLPREYHLVLNGDIEELQKFRWDQIRAYWKPLYNLFDQFESRKSLYKTVGNHDFLLAHQNFHYPYEVHESLEIQKGRDSMLVYHGHQFSRLLQRYEALCKFTLQFVAYPLGIMNYSKSPDSRKKMKTELRAYEASRRQGIISVIGHTHRPLFESLSKKDSLKFRIDNLIRRYRSAGELEQYRIKCEIRQYQNELSLLKESGEFHISELYSSESLLPCLFNSGCAIGKRGMTALEIDREEIQLVYWYNTERNSDSSSPIGYDYYEIPGTSLRKVILNREKLSYIMDKMRLMTLRPSPSFPDTSLSFQPLPD